MIYRKRRIVTFAVVGLLVYLALSALPVGALQTNTALGSIHTNETDFNSATELTNVTVEGGGSAAYVDFDTADLEGTTATRPSDDTSNSDNIKVGAEIKPNRNLAGVKIDISGSTSGATTAYLYESDGTTLLDSSPISGGSATLTADLTSGQKYFAVVDAGGASFTRGYRAFDSPPYTSGDIDITAPAGEAGGVIDNSTFNDIFAVRSTTALIPGPTEGTYISSTESVDNAVTGFTNLTLSNTEAHVTWLADTNGDGSFETEAATQTYTTSGNKTLSLSGTDSTDWRVNVSFSETGSNPVGELHDEGVLFTNHEPQIDNSSATPTGKLTTANPTLSVDIEDTEFGTAQGDSVDVEFFVDGSSIGTDTLTSNGSASQSHSFVGGDHTWHVEASDDYGGSNQSDTFSLTAPSNLTIREEKSPYNIITSCGATVRFFEDVNTNPVIVERTDSDGDGNVSLSGLPVGTEFTAAISCDNYHNRTIIIDSIFDQTSVFLINTSRNTHAVRFTVDDRTGDFPADETEVIIQKAINRSEYGETPSGFSWTNVAGDDVGSAGAFTTDLVDSNRYRIVVQNEDSDSRILGSYTPKATGTEVLTIGRVVLDPTGTDQPEINVYRTNQSTAPVRVNFEYNDSLDATDTIWLEIYEYNNQSNVLLSNTSFSGPFGTFANVEDVPSADEDRTWVVKFTAVRTGEDDIVGQIVVGPQRAILQDLPAWLITVIFVGSIWMVAGLFSQLNGHIGGIAVAGLGALFFFINLVPTALGSGVMILSLITGGIIFIRETRGGGL